MKTNFFSDSTNVDELVFENRNHAYGAYNLRKTYEERLTLSTMATVSFFMLLFIAAFLVKPQPIELPSYKPSVLDVPVIDTKILTFVDPPRMFPPMAAPGNVVPIIVNEPVKPVELPVDNTKLSDGNGKGTDIHGSKDGIKTSTFVDAFTTTDTLITIHPPVITDFTPYYDKGPEFMGGQSAYERYLQSNMQYPEMAVSNGIQGTIYVMVKIDENGKIMGAEILKGIGGGCDQEAMRVIKNMPSWKPGQMNGKPVAVKCVLKVKMLLQN
ncbi:MAG: energy transducer TonB [Sphingobacteriales bacterium]|nr:MAG: energy transducer TonB [Sphingobacteriales bacterium]